jgi:hypothetical protein
MVRPSRGRYLCLQDIIRPYQYANTTRFMEKWLSGRTARALDFPVFDGEISESAQRLEESLDVVATDIYSKNFGEVAEWSKALPC